MIYYSKHITGGNGGRFQVHGMLGYWKRLFLPPASLPSHLFLVSIFFFLHHLDVFTTDHCPTMRAKNTSLGNCFAAIALYQNLMPYAHTISLYVKYSVKTRCGDWEQTKFAMRNVEVGIILLDTKKPRSCERGFLFIPTPNFGVGMYLRSI